MPQNAVEFVLSPEDTSRLGNLCGAYDEHLRHIEQRLGVELLNRGCRFKVLGPESVALVARQLIETLYAQAGEELTREEVHLALAQAAAEATQSSPVDDDRDEVVIKTKRGIVRGRGPRQQNYLRQIRAHDLTFGIGPAGTGKTYLAVACAVHALARDEVRRLVLVRPAVEAGERLGFLPGDLAEKIDPYLRPLFDALYEMLGFEQVQRLIERNVIEVAPLAFMRGRTLNDAFVILDEAQNTTIEQMKMFLTRLGFGSTAVVTGDMTQVDLPRAERSGLKHCIDVLKEVRGIAITQFVAQDVVRHPLVQRIVQAYDAHESGGA